MKKIFLLIIIFCFFIPENTIAKTIIEKRGEASIPSIYELEENIKVAKLNSTSTELIKNDNPKMDFNKIIDY